MSISIIFKINGRKVGGQLTVEIEYRKKLFEYLLLCSTIKINKEILVNKLIEIVIKSKCDLEEFYSCLINHQSFCLKINLKQNSNFKFNQKYYTIAGFIVELFFCDNLGKSIRDIQKYHLNNNLDENHICLNFHHYNVNGNVFTEKISINDVKSEKENEIKINQEKLYFKSWLKKSLLLSIDIDVFKNINSDWVNFFLTKLIITIIILIFLFIKIAFYFA